MKKCLVIMMAVIMLMSMAHAFAEESWVEITVHNATMKIRRTDVIQRDYDIYDINAEIFNIWPDYQDDDFVHDYINIKWTPSELGDVSSKKEAEFYAMGTASFERERIAGEKIGIQVSNGKVLNVQALPNEKTVMLFMSMDFYSIERDEKVIVYIMYMFTAAEDGTYVFSFGSRSLDVLQMMIDKYYSTVQIK